MFGGDDDPFGMGAFNHMHQHMRQMDRMMESMMDPFGIMGMPRPMMGMIDVPRRQQPHPYQVQQQQQLNPFSPFGGMMGMGGFGGMFSAMNQLQHQAMNDPNAHVFSQSTMMTFGQDGQPRVVKKSLSKRGDVREERRHVRDGELEEMEIGHSIGDRSHVIEKKRDKDGNVRRQQKFVNLDEANAEAFDHEFTSRARNNHFPRHRQPELQSTSYRDTSTAGAPIITLPEEDEPTRPRTSSGNRLGGPVIREISEEEAESSISKRRRGPRGAYYD